MTNILYELVVLDLGNDKLPVISAIGRVLSLSAPEALKASRDLPCSLASGSFLDLAELKQHLTDLGARVELREFRARPAQEP